ncbi:MAG TPA: tryptophan 2,3-dioxygenase family protein [Blastocatellia bacterium]|nr:tryptophan 2,3-dioxygenase family protein [Blastocatellia bacterium]
MSFGLPPDKGEGKLTYGGYLKIEELISLQNLLSNPPQHDEMLFIIIHQVYELWFKELLHEVDTIIEHLNANRILAAHRLLRRCIEIERVLVSQIAVLETMTPQDFLTFRDNLMPASGFQSWQFRELEIASGLKDSGSLKNYPESSVAFRQLTHRLESPSMRDAFYGVLARRGFKVGGEHSASNEEAVTELTRIFQDAENHYDLFLLAESLIEYDEMFSLWRLRHVKMVERMIGGKIGTGGSQGAAYLWTTVGKTFYPELWATRTRLSASR